MTLRPLATRVPRELEQEIHEIMQFLKVEKAQAVRTILELGISEWRKRNALDLLRDGKVTFAKAAKLAKLDLWDLADLVRERKTEWVRFEARDIEGKARKGQ
jgi:predicted HTH domain antitoxin